MACSGRHSVTSVRRLVLPAGEAGGSGVDPEGGSVFFVGTATVVLKYAGFTILTDPNFLHAGDHAHLGYGITSRRLTEPAIDIDRLPPLDLCVLSHHHGDHFDPIAEERLRKDLPIVTTAHAARTLRKRGFTETVALDTWQSVDVRKQGASVRISAMPGQHGPALVHRLLPPVMGSMLEFEPTPGEGAALRVYITGDTLLFDELLEIPRRYPEIDLALFHLGGTRVLGILLTMDGDQGARALRLVNPREAIPIHYDDYDVFRSPLSDFQRAVERAGLAGRVRYLSRGDTYRFEAPRRAGRAPSLQAP
jgi:L-ascorbate metabolism protein UlaG (beta-lactamase superfamily)